MSTMPQNPVYEIIQNWQNLATTTIQKFRTRAETMRQKMYARIYGPAGTPPAAFVGPLRRLAMSRTTRSPGGRRVSGKVIPHVTQYEAYDFTYKRPSGGAPVTAKRLGVEGEPWDFTF